MHVLNFKKKIILFYLCPELDDLFLVNNDSSIHPVMHFIVDEYRDYESLVSNGSLKKLHIPKCILFLTQLGFCQKKPHH